MRFARLALDRRAALWAARRLDVIGIRTTRQNASATVEGALPLLAPHLSDELFPEPSVALPAMPLCEHVVEDYVATGLSLKEHPVRFFRDRLTARGVMRNTELRGDGLRQDSMVTVAGLVLVRQRPGTAKGVIFMTLEDETDIANIIVWPKAFEKNRRVVMTARFLAVRGRLQRAGLVIHVVAESFIDLSAELSSLRDGELYSADSSRRTASGVGFPTYQEPRLSLSTLAHALSQHAREAIGKQFRIRRPVALQHPRLVEQQMRRVLLQRPLVFAERRERDHKLMSRIDLQDRLRRRVQPACSRQQLFQRPVGACIRSNQADRTVGEPVRGAHFGDRVAERVLHESQKVLDRIMQLRRRYLLRVEQRNERQIGRALGHRFERFALEPKASHDPEAVDRVRQQQNLDAAGAEALEMGR